VVFRVCPIALGDPPYSDCKIVIVAFSSFATASVFSSRPLTADVIFPAISLFMLLQFPLAMVRNTLYLIKVLLLTLSLQFSQVTSNVIEALVSVKRLSEFLHAEELQQDAVKRLDKPSLSIGDEVLAIRDGEFQWTRNGIQPALEGINLTVRKGELVGILGRVGAGKVSVLFLRLRKYVLMGDAEQSAVCHHR